MWMMKLLALVVFMLTVHFQVSASDCGEEINALLDYSQSARKHEKNIVEFVMTESKEVGKWYSYFNNWEGQTVTVTPDFFNFMNKESEILGIIAGQIAGNSKSLEKQFNQLITDMKDCIAAR